MAHHPLTHCSPSPVVLPLSQCCRLGLRSVCRRVLEALLGRGDLAVMQPPQASAGPTKSFKAGMALQGCPKQG